MKELNSIFEKHVEAGLYPGVEWKITINEEIYHGKIGYKNIDTQEYLQENSIYRIWSMTKPIVSLVALQLIE